MEKKKSKKYLSSSEKKRVADVLKYFQNSALPTKELCVQETVKATSVSRATVMRIQKELKTTGKLSSPTRKKRGAYKPVDDFDRTVTCNKVKEFYTQRQQLPTLTNLHKVLQADIDYPCSREILRQTLNNMGFTWKKTSDNRKVLIERPHVVSLRLQFYARKKELQDQGYTFVYVDETWLDSCYTMKKSWQGPGLSGPCPPCNRSQRLIVVHAGSQAGFIPGAKLIYKASCSTGDYHHEMDGKQFTKWIQEKLLPNLPDKCAIVMDNASYHSMQSEKCPTTSTRKEDIKIWLQNHRITFDYGMLKPQLLQLVKLNKPGPTYVIDELIRSQGHEVLRLPPYHPEFNAIELIWSQLKQIVRKRNITFRLNDMMRIADEAFGEIGDERWRSAYEHVEKAVEAMKVSDHYFNNQTEKFIIHLEDSSDGSETETAEEDTDTASEIEAYL